MGMRGYVEKVYQKGGEKVCERGEGDDVDGNGLD